MNVSLGVNCLACMATEISLGLVSMRNAVIFLEANIKDLMAKRQSVSFRIITELGPCLSWSLESLEIEFEIILQLFFLCYLNKILFTLTRSLSSNLFINESSFSIYAFLSWRMGLTISDSDLSIAAGRLVLFVISTLTELEVELLLLLLLVMLVVILLVFVVVVVFDSKR